MNRILTWHDPEKQGDGRFGPAYYMDIEYEPVAVRIHAETAPYLADAEFQILDDGVSIFSNRASNLLNKTTGVLTVGTPSTTAVLMKGESSEPDAEDFNNITIEVGSWLTCELVNNGGGKNFTVQLELEQVSDDEEKDEE
jgi:hypothetical protein